MDWFVKAFVKASLVWFGLGATLGVAMAVHPPWSMYRTAHFHLNLLGFVTMMIYGVAYHVMPRFSGNPLRSRRLAVAHWWLSNLGLALLVVGFVLTPHVGRVGRVPLALGGALSAAGAYAFIYNLWRTIDRRASAKSNAATAGAPDFATVQRARNARATIQSA
jgi:cbb3-type cytochrome oxidase subunit 1